MANFPWMPVYHLEAYYEHPEVLKVGELVVITEKVAGYNVRYCYYDGKLWAGSRKIMRGASLSHGEEMWTQIKVGLYDLFDIPHDLKVRAYEALWWQIADRYDLKHKMEFIPNLVVFGEVYGTGVQGREAFRVFDIWDGIDSRWLEFDEMSDVCRGLDLDIVPVLYRGPWAKELLHAAEGFTTIVEGEHLREGVVVKAYPERKEAACGRVALKVISEPYLLEKEVYK